MNAAVYIGADPWSPTKIGEAEMVRQVPMHEILGAIGLGTFHKLDVAGGAVNIGYFLTRRTTTWCRQDDNGMVEIEHLPQTIGSPGLYRPDTVDFNDDEGTDSTILLPQNGQSLYYLQEMDNPQGGTDYGLQGFVTLLDEQRILEPHNAHFVVTRLPKIDADQADII